MQNEETLSNDTRHEASSLHDKLLKFENIFRILVWNDILVKIHKTNLTLQKENINLAVVVNLLDCLEKYLENLRGKFEDYLNKAKELTRIEEIPKKRIRIRSNKITRYEGLSENTTYNEEDSLKIEIFYQIIDSLSLNIKQSRAAYDKMKKDFSFYVNLREMGDEEIERNCKNLAEKYGCDLSADILSSECIQFKYYLQEITNENLLIIDLYKQIKTDCLISSFPNIEICLRIFLSMMVSNCSGERSFSALRWSYIKKFSKIQISFY